MDFLQGLELAALVVAVNLFLGGVGALGSFIAAQTENTTDDKIFSWVGKISGWLSKLADILGNNSRPK